MNAKKLSILVSLLFLATLFYGQDDEKEIIKEKETVVINKSNELGLHAGFTTGLGLSFRHWSDKFGVQITAIPIKANDFQFISGGLTGMYSLVNKKYHRFYLYFGNHVLISNELLYFDGVRETELMYNLGFGPGFEVGKNVRFNVMVGYAAYNITNAPDYSLLPTIEMGLYFKL